VDLEGAGFDDAAAEIAVADKARLIVGRCAEEEIEGLVDLICVTPVPVPIEAAGSRRVEVEEPEPEEASYSPVLSFPLSFLPLSFLVLGLGGGLSASSDSALTLLDLLSLKLFSSFTACASDSNIFVNPSPTRGL